LKRYEDALNDFNKVLNLNPEVAQTYLHRGNTYEMLRQPQKACQDWQQAVAKGIKEAQEYINNQCK
jgi:tetratricopeptide (TPR) repeat protein